MTKLRGLAWDHRRCWGPLDASVVPYCQDHPGLQIEWDRRSLYEFGEGSLADVLSCYDLVIFDHPFIGDIAEGDLMVPFSDHLSTEALNAFAGDSVGKSWISYARNERQWALPIDAACQVASYRPDLLERYGAPPTTHTELIALASKIRQDGKWIGLPSVPTDALCMLLTFCAQKTGNDLYGFVDRRVVESAVADLQQLTALAHPLSRQWNPIRCYDHMVANDDVVYVPYAFGYVNYASKADARHLRFTDIPAENCAGALLGGAGIGVSAHSKNPGEAVAYAIHLSSPRYQCSAYVDAGGQPGSLSAWQDAGVNGRTRNFFKDSLKTMSASYLRPTDPGFIGFFRQAAADVTKAIYGEMMPRDLSSLLDRLYTQAHETRLRRKAV
ncbi:MAG: ABC transporter substrate-binding protein [Phyllobacterium sp.]|uniref:ABC transporter substrate-binding protein n=1 Tax=Phyllobacterium sp. TaxID=1871046 RepID=UPI0030F0F52D